MKNNSLNIFCKILLKLNLLLFTLTVFAQTQNVNTKNVSISTQGDMLIIYYEITSGGKANMFNIVVNVKTKTGSIITPKSLSGDFGSVSKKGSKKIIWNVYNDISSIDIEQCFVMAYPIIKQKTSSVKQKTSSVKQKRRRYSESFFGIKLTWGLGMIDVISPNATGLGYKPGRESAIENFRPETPVTHLISAPLEYSLFWTLKSTGSFGLRTELNYARRGFTELTHSNFNIGNQVFEAYGKKFRIDYAQIPVHLLYIKDESNSSGTYTYYVGPGGYFGYAFGGYVLTNQIKYQIFDKSIVNEFGMPINREDFGLSMIAGAKTSNGNFEINAYRSFRAANINNQNYWVADNTLNKEKISYWGMRLSFFIYMKN